MREISLEQLRTQVTNAEPPTVSLHVAEWESRPGAALLLRQRQRVVPTGVGRGLIARARRLLAETFDIGLVALPQPAVKGLQIVPWRRDPVMAFMPRAWTVPRTITPAWLAARPLILNDPSTRLHRMTMDWFAAAGERPQARIELNFNDAIKSLVAAGYGAALLPREEGTASPDARMVASPLTPRLWRPLGLAYRAGRPEPATRHMLDALVAIRQR